MDTESKSKFTHIDVQLLQAGKAFHEVKNETQMKTLVW